MFELAFELNFELYFELQKKKCNNNNDLSSKRRAWYITKSFSSHVIYVVFGWSSLNFAVSLNCHRLFTFSMMVFIVKSLEFDLHLSYHVCSKPQ